MVSEEKTETTSPSADEQIQAIADDPDNFEDTTHDPEAVVEAPVEAPEAPESAPESAEVPEDGGGHAFALDSLALAIMPFPSAAS